MLRPKKLIPPLAGAMLALTGCGDDGNTGGGGSGGSGGSGGTGGSEGGELANAIGAWCMQLRDCFPPYYQDTERCISSNVAYYGLDGDIVAACETAAISYFECGADLSCEQLDLFYNDCDDAWNDAVDNCPDWPSFLP
jgi:hypothetical protein